MNEISEHLLLSDNKQLLFFKNNFHLSGITTNLFGDTSYQNLEQEQELNLTLSRSFSAISYHKLEVKHQDEIIVLNKNSYSEANYHQADGLIAFGKNHFKMLLCNTGDCPIVILTDPSRELQAIIHSGWRGCRLSITRKAILKICEVGFEAEDLIATVWPGIDFEHYIFGEKDGANFPGHYFNNRLNLQSVINEQLLRSGLRPEHIQIPNISSASHNYVTGLAFRSFRLRREMERNMVFLFNNACVY
ncbi:polyphenol oxidase family protein [Candidatus Falkowbacteria bacterium]|nr:polyphenol oxidase family protein [Candidatus Falkowbacteria bacterium]